MPGMADDHRGTGHGGLFDELQLGSRSVGPRTAGPHAAALQLGDPPQQFLGIAVILLGLSVFFLCPIQAERRKARAS